jgi:hypothetical protein
MDGWNVGAAVTVWMALVQKAIEGDGSHANTKKPRQYKRKHELQDLEQEGMQKLRVAKGKTRSGGEPGRRSVHPRRAS